jgi:IrrE N-terminal-like domain
MADDYRVRPRSDLEVRGFAKKVRDFFGVATHRRVDVLACLGRGSVWTVRGVKRLNFQVRPDAEMGLDDGSTSYDEDVVTVAVKRSIYDDAFLGVGRARNTHAHELGHAVMHDGAQMARRAAGNISPGWIKPYESAEHQTKIFAPAFLIHDKIAEVLSCAEDIAIEFGISLESAQIYHNELTKLRDREKNAEKILRIAEAFRARTTPPRFKIQFLNEPCPACGRPTLFPVGNKFMCQTCNSVTDRFPDGDSIDT